MQGEMAPFFFSCHFIFPFVFAFLFCIPIVYLFNKSAFSVFALVEIYETKLRDINLLRQIESVLQPLNIWNSSFFGLRSTGMWVSLVI